jgi:hypothetical protein
VVYVITRQDDVNVSMVFMVMIARLLEVQIGKDKKEM